jgi:hypothetical protein
MILTVVAIGRIFQSGALMAAFGKLSNGSGMLDTRAFSYSTCKITKVLLNLFFLPLHVGTWK